MDGIANRLRLEELLSSLIHYECALVGEETGGISQEKIKRFFFSHRKFEILYEIRGREFYSLSRMCHIYLIIFICVKKNLFAWLREQGNTIARAECVLLSYKIKIEKRINI